MKNSRPERTEVPPSSRGSALIMIIFTVFLLMLVISAIFALSRQNFLSVNHDEYKDKAAYAAKAGLEHAISMMAENPNLGAVSENPNGWMSGDIELETDPDITYKLHLINNDEPTNSNTIVEAPDGLKIPPRVVWVKSTGALRDRSKSSSSSLVKLVGFQRPILKQALFGINFVEVSGGSTVEGYDSKAHFTPTLPPASPAPAVAVAGMGRRGDVGVNATRYSAGNSGLFLESGSTVHGQLRAGVGSPNWNSVMTVNGTQDHLEDPSNPRVVSEEATQVPRFVLNTDSTGPNFLFPHQLAVLDLSSLPTPPAPLPTPPVAYMPVGATSSVTFTPINDTKTPGTSQTPAPEPTLTGYDDLRVLNPGYYDMRGQGGQVRLEDVVLAPGARYHFLGDVTFAGRVNVAFHNPQNNPPSPFDPEEGPLPVVIYVDGDVNFEPGTNFNMDWEDEDRDGDATEPLPPRRIQIYTSNDRDEEFQNDTHTVTIGGSGPKSNVSAVFVGSNMKAVVSNSNLWGGLQGLDVRVKESSHVYFDVNLWGTPLEGRGQVAVLLNTVQVYTPITAPAPPSVPSTVPASSPSYSSYYTTGYCSPIMPAPVEHEMEFCVAY